MMFPVSFLFLASILMLRPSLSDFGKDGSFVSMFLFIPLALGSFWAVFTFFPILITVILRILKEGEVMLRDLPDYRDYCKRLPYRLIPFVW